MDALELLFPLTYLPGVALLIISASRRYTHVNDQIHGFSEEECRMRTQWVLTELRKAGLFRNAMIGLYMSTALFSLGSLTAFIASSRGPETSKTLLEISSVAGVACILFSVSYLVIDSVLTLDILEKHAKRHIKQGDDGS